MTAGLSNHEVWVIDDEQALLYRQREQAWQLENKVPFAEFTGSALALSSFTLPDTCVYVNLRPQKNEAGRSPAMTWLGIQYDPLRLIEVDDSEPIQHILRELRSMDQQAQIISTDKPQHFKHATPLFLAYRSERQHLKKWIADQKSGSRLWVSNVRLWLAMWLRPDRNYQSLRAVAAGCTVFVLLFAHWHNSQLIEQQNDRTQAAIKNETARLETMQQQVPFEDWAVQIKKFGQGKRANLTALNFHWGSDGTIHTFARLDRDRKRAPKGCDLLDSKRAQCKTNTTQP